MKKEKRFSGILFTAIMLVVFFLITEYVIWGDITGFMYNSISNYPQGKLVITEAILASLVFIVLLLFKNSYVFTQKKQKLRVGLFYGLFYILYGIAFTLLFGVLLGAFKEPHAVFNTAVGCLLIGICEEFLCRGWLLNEFLEKFGDTKKGVWYSIIISGLIFGIIHIGNMGAGQSVASTVTQVMGAISTGVVFGVIYYKTKNIWSVVILHALWDFSLMLSTIAPSYESSAITTETTVVSMIFTILMAAAELIVVIPHIKNIDDKPKRGFVIGMSCLAFVLYAGFINGEGFTSQTFGDTYKYENITMEKYSVTSNNYDEYYIKENKMVFKLGVEDGKLLFTNENTKYNIELKATELCDYIIVENNDQYIIAYVDFLDTSNTYLRYAIVPKDYLSDADTYLDSLSNSFKEYLLPDAMRLLVIGDGANNRNYLAAYNADYGYYLLTKENEMSILNRD